MNENLKKLIKLSYFVLILSCSSQLEARKKQPSKILQSLIDSEKTYFSYEHLERQFTLERVRLVRNKKVNLRSSLINNKKKIEKQIYSVADIGHLMIANKKIAMTRPMISQFKYQAMDQKLFSQIKLNKEKRGLEVIWFSEADSENAQMTPKNEFVKLGANQILCFLTQVPECLARLNFLKESIENKLNQITLTLIWESYPYTEKIYENISNVLLSPATITYDGFKDDVHKFAMESNGQVIFYHFDNRLNFNKMYWVAQGISAELR